METTRKLVILVLLFSLPFAYLFFRLSHGPTLPTVETNNPQAPHQHVLAAENAARKNPSFENLLHLADTYQNNTMPEKSIGPLQLAISMNPQSAKAHAQLGVAYVSVQQYQTGIDALQKAIQIDSTFQPAKENLEWATYEKNRVLMVIQLLEKTPSERRNVAFLLEYGLNYFKIGEYEKSIEIWKKILEADKRNVQALGYIGTAFILKKQYEDAIDALKKVLEIDPANQLAQKNLAWIMQEKRKLVTGH